MFLNMYANVGTLEEGYSYALGQGFLHCLQHITRTANPSHDWPEPPAWMATVHHAFHSFPMLFCAAAIARIISGHWPHKEVMAWALHILIDIPNRWLLVGGRGGCGGVAV
jgi:hypothetical protein